MGKRVLLTGGNGFLGMYVQEALGKRPWAGAILAPHKSDYNLLEGGEVSRMFEEQKPDIVIHLAASVGGIGANRAHPAKFFYENLMMGVLTMHEAWKAGVEKFVAIGTICAYPKFTPVPFREERLWDGYPEETNAPYGLAKKMLLVQAQTYREEYGFHAIYLLPVNLYGPGDNFDLETGHAIPSLIRKFCEARDRGEKTVTLWGDGTPTREFFFVEDAAEGIVLATEQYDKPEPVNLGTGKEIAMRDLASLIQEMTRYKGKIIWDTSKPNGQPARRLDVSKAKKEFGFEAKVGLEEGLEKTIAWYEENKDHLREVHFGM